MYNPPHFKEERLPVLHELIREHGFATLVTLGPDGLVANHIPMEIVPGEGALGTLRGHVARANPVWQTSTPGAEALAIFQGPHGYISPSWYQTKEDNGKVVPTWNYAVVHAHGPLQVIDDPMWLRALVEQLTATHEGRRDHPWHVTDAPADYIDKQLRSIVGLEIPLTRLEGKWKVSQNRSLEDRAAVVRGLREAGDPSSLAMADLVARAAAERARP